MIEAGAIVNCVVVYIHSYHDQISHDIRQQSSVSSFILAENSVYIEGITAMEVLDGPQITAPYKTVNRLTKISNKKSE